MWRTNGLRAPGPTSMTTPWWIFSVALSGSTIEPTCLVVFCSAWRENTHTEPVMRRRKLKEEEKSVRGQTKVADEDTVAEGLQGLDEAHHRAVARGSSAHGEGHSVQVLTRRRREPRKRGQKRDSHSVTLSFRGCTALPHFLHITQVKDRLCHTDTRRKACGTTHGESEHAQHARAGAAACRARRARDQQRARPRPRTAPRRAPRPRGLPHAPSRCLPAHRSATRSSNSSNNDARQHLHLRPCRHRQDRPRARRRHCPLLPFLIIISNSNSISNHSCSQHWRTSCQAHAPCRA